MLRKAVIAGAVLVGLLGPASTAWAGSGPAEAGTKGFTSAEVASAAPAASGERKWNFCGHGYQGWVTVNSHGDITGGFYWHTTRADCQGEIITT